MEPLKTDYKNDVLDTSKNQLRKYQQIQNDDGTVSFVDVTEYTTTGTSFGAKDINDTNAAVNVLNNSLNNMFKEVVFSKYSGDGISGYYSKLITFEPNNIPEGYKIHSLKSFFHDNGTFIAIASSVSDNNITLRVCNFSPNLTYPGTMTLVLNLIRK